MSQFISDVQQSYYYFIPSIWIKFLIPFWNNLQDNDSKHTSRSTKEWMMEKGMLDSVMKTPASSPDLNPIENVWATMKYHLQTHVKPRTKEELVGGIRSFWGALLLNSVPDTLTIYTEWFHRLSSMEGHPLTSNLWCVEHDQNIFDILITWHFVA